MQHGMERPWQPPAATDLGGPEQLADVMIDFRRWHAAKGLYADGELSDDALRKLIKLAYFASQASDEGRYPQFRLFCPAAEGRAAIDSWRILHFAEPRPLKDVNSLRRLAPSVASHERALLVRHNKEGLVCEGLVAVPRGGPFGPPQTGLPFRPDGFMLRVDGPGMLLATEAGLTFAVRAGHVHNLSPYHMIDPVKNWLQELAETLLGRCATDAAVAAERGIPSSPTAMRLLIRSIWADVLQSTVQLRHGGAFMILPEPQAAPLRQKIEVRHLDLGDDLEAYWRARLWADVLQNKSDAAKLIQECHAKWHRLVGRTKALAHLSGVDGCVVLDRELHVSAFGGMIEVDPNRTAAPASHEDYWTHEPVRTGEGTRHESARNLCQTQRGALAFVISQDGDVTLFFNDNDRVHRAGPLSAADGGDW